MEFIMKTDLKQLPKQIEFNDVEIQNELTERLAPYNTLVVTEDGIKDAKTDRAKLNKLKIAVLDRYKEVKKIYSDPLVGFKSKIDDIVKIIDESIEKIDSQVKVFESQEQQQKWEQITEYYNAEVKELKELVPLEKIVSSKWKNKTKSLESVNNAIGDTLERIRGELETISTLHSPYEQQIKDVYLNDYNLSKALMEQKRLEERQKQLEEMERQKEERRKQAEEAERKRQEELKARQEEQQRTAHSVPEPVAEPPKAEPAPQPEPTQQAESEKMLSGTFRVTGTKSQIIALNAFLKSNNIKFEIVK